MSLAFDNIEVIGQVLDYLELGEEATRFTIIGGAAMAAYGLKDVWHTDIDIAVTPELMNELSGERRAVQAMDNPQEASIVPTDFYSRDRLIKYSFEMREKPYISFVPITAIVAPLDEMIYSVTSEELIQESCVLPGSKYKAIPLSRIASWKEAMAREIGPSDPAYLKHQKDAQHIRNSQQPALNRLLKSWIK